MATRHTPSAASHEQQPTLFHGSLNFDWELRHQLNIAIDAAPISRKEIAVRMSDLSASKVTVDHLNAWTAPSRAKWNIPFRLAPAFDVATNSTHLLDFLAQKHGRTVLSPQEALDAELGALARQEAEIQQRRAQIMSALQTVRGGR